MQNKKNFLKIAGTTEDPTLIDGFPGFQAKTNPGLFAARVKNSLPIARVRGRLSEFARAVAGARLIRKAVSPLRSNPPSAKEKRSLVNKLLEIIMYDQANSPGNRTISKGPVDLLEGFKFHSPKIPGVAMNIKVRSTTNRLTGELTIHVPAFIPAVSINPPPCATHFSFLSAGIELDFEQKEFIRDVKEIAAIAWDTTPTAEMDIVHQVTTATTNVLVLVFGIRFFQSAGDVMNPMPNGSGNRLTILATSKV